MNEPIRVGVVGCGLIAQVMHLPYLNELSEHYEIAAVCDISESLAAACARRYRVARAHSRWEDLIGDDLDAVLILTSGDHAPIGVAAAQAGMHVFAEKPMALSVTGCTAMIEAARAAGVQLMVGTMKRYDPAYTRLAELIVAVRDQLRLVRVTTLESPLTPYVAHLPLVSADPACADTVERLRLADERIVEVALAGLGEETRWCYRWILLDCLVHELNALRGVLGEPTDVVSASLTRECVGINLRFGPTECHLSWVDLPGIPRYRQQLAFYAPERRLTLEFASPFLRNAPTRLIVEEGLPGGGASFEREEIASYDEAFRLELLEFADCIATGRTPHTSGEDGLADVRLCEAVARAARELQ